MKNLLKFLGIIALVAVIGFSMASCDNGNGGDNPDKKEVEKADITTSSSEELDTYLSDKPVNTPTTPYIIALNVSDLTDIGNLLKENSDKYVKLDLSGSSITSIGNYAFDRCTSLIGVTIPNSVTSIGEWAFCESGLTGPLTIPSSVNSIGQYAFSRCNLTSVTFRGTIPSSGFASHAFYSESDLRDKFYELDSNGTPGTYKRSGTNYGNYTWVLDGGSGAGSTGFTVNSTAGILTINGFPSRYNGVNIFAQIEGNEQLATYENITVTSSAKSITVIYGTITNGSVTLKVWKNPSFVVYNNFTGSGNYSIDLLELDPGIKTATYYIDLQSGVGARPIALDVDVSFTNGVGTVDVSSYFDTDGNFIPR